ncbi:RNA polymerase sigma factor [Kribbella sp. CA-293567]|uniref:RNA polymerase sigma factor n=1 Tax=Kribbella sp. CA-293567 TaxID=3002436 RepID=UPI0022DDC15A|nr:RNA polymerase sigma factor [Kribbella sp. CA-293567]WBQ03417.1 RNA polymerase sigma factor [Kribbella sp. CA-293567]
MVDESAGDAAQWQAMRGGDMAALGVLFDRHADRVHRYCRRAAGGSVDSEDVLSETFIEVWRSRRSFVVREGSALPILLTIAKRVLQKQVRSAERATRRDGRAGDPTLLVVPDIAEDAVRAVELERQRVWLRRQVAAMPVPYRNVYELCVYAELGQDEVARLLGIPLGTVKSRLSRARKNVAEAAQEAFEQHTIEGVF